MRGAGKGRELRLTHAFLNRGRGYGKEMKEQCEAQEMSHHCSIMVVCLLDCLLQKGSESSKNSCSSTSEECNTETCSQSDLHCNITLTGFNSAWFVLPSQEMDRS